MVITKEERGCFSAPSSEDKLWGLFHLLFYLDTRETKHQDWIYF